MYRTDGTDSLQKIERLERELNLAYEEQFPTTNDADVGLALLRFRAQRLARDIESFREKHQREPLWKRLKKNVTRFGLGLGFVAGACVVSMTWGALTLRMNNERAYVDGLEAHETPPPQESVQTAEPAATEAPVESAEPASTAEPTPPSEADARSTQDVPARNHFPLSLRDHKEMLAASQSYFHGVAKRDGAALARLAHPTKGIVFEDEHLSFTPALLRDCFVNRHVYEVPVNSASDDVEKKTCGDVLASYQEKAYARAPDVLINAVPANVAANGAQPDAPFLFFYLPPEEGSELSWEGVTLAFERYGSEMVLVSVQRQYWTP